MSNTKRYVAEMARRATIAGLLRGRVYQATTATGEVITLGRHTPAVGATGWAIYGYQRGACRDEVIPLATAAVDRFMELAARPRKVAA